MDEVSVWWGLRDLNPPFRIENPVSWPIRRRPHMAARMGVEPILAERQSAVLAVKLAVELPGHEWNSLRDSNSHFPLRRRVSCPLNEGNMNKARFFVVIAVLTTTPHGDGDGTRTRNFSLEELTKRICCTRLCVEPPAGFEPASPVRETGIFAVGRRKRVVRPQGLEP